NSPKARRQACRSAGPAFTRHRALSPLHRLTAASKIGRSPRLSVAVYASLAARSNSPARSPMHAPAQHARLGAAQLDLGVAGIAHYQLEPTAEPRDDRFHLIEIHQTRL